MAEIIDGDKKNGSCFLRMGRRTEMAKPCVKFYFSLEGTNITSTAPRMIDLHNYMIWKTIKVGSFSIMVKLTLLDQVI